ncbi:MAG TPA: glycosyltransferase family 1 protein [Anaerolineae bacterium]
MTRLRIVLDGRIINDHFPGIGRYAHRLASALARTGQVDLVLLHNPALPNTRYPLDALKSDNLTFHPIDIAPFTLAEQTRLPALARQLKPDVWHAPYYSMSYRRLRCPTVVTFYDTIPLSLPQFWPVHQRWIFRFTHRLVLRVADRAIAISDSTRRDLIRYFRADARRVVVTPLAADEHFKPQPDAEIRRVRRQYQLPDRLILYVGINKPPKNLARLIQAYARLGDVDFACVIAGAWDNRYPEAKRIAADLGLGERVRFLGPVAEADLPALYASADVFVTASLYEGFGLPALEAMACGTPVACSRTSSLPEVVGDAGLLFDPLDVDAIAGAIRQVMSDGQLRADLRRHSLERARQFTWERVAEQTIAIYQSVGGLRDADLRG